MQRIYNYGSSLQAYGLKRLIERVDGATVRFVDYRPGPPLEAAAPVAPWRRALAKAAEYGRTPAPLPDRVRFLNHKRGYARYFAELGIPATADRDLDCDVEVVGSDEVFNCFQSNTRVGYSGDLFGRGSGARRLVSYAASFGNTTLERIHRAGLGQQLGEDLLRFDALSVRDANSAGVVEALTGAAPPIHVDPALAYDFTRESRVPGARQHPRPYLIVYGYSGRLSPAENRTLRHHADSIGAEILTFGGLQECGDRFIDCSPFELLAWFRDAEAVVTDTFHGTIFSIVNRVPFATLVRSSTDGGYGNEEKLGHLLESFGLSERRLGDPDDLARLLSTPLDGPAIDHRLKQERRRTAEYLTTVIGNREAA
jgi:hypothetical protein